MGGALTNAAHPNLRIRILLVLPQAAEGAGEDVLGRIRVVVRKEDTPAVIEPLAGFALDLWVVYQVLRTAAADASGPIRPVLVIILSKSKIGTLALPTLGWNGLSGEEPV